MGQCVGKSQWILLLLLLTAVTGVRVTREEIHCTPRVPSLLHTYTTTGKDPFSPLIQVADRSSHCHALFFDHCTTAMEAPFSRNSLCACFLSFAPSRLSSGFSLRVSPCLSSSFHALGFLHLNPLPSYSQRDSVSVWACTRADAGFVSGN